MFRCSPWRPLTRALSASTLATLLLAGCASSPDLSTASGQVTIGSRAARQGLWREAMFRYDKAVKLEPNNAMALSNLGVAYESSGEFEKAREVYLKALQADRANPYIQKNYSRFSEFYAKFKKREPKVLDGEQAPGTEAQKAPEGEKAAGAANAPEPPKAPEAEKEKTP